MGAESEFFEGRMQAGRSEVLGPMLNGVIVFDSDNLPADITILDIKAKDSVCEMVTVYLDATQENGPDNIARVPSGPDPSPQPFQPYVFAKLEWGNDGYQSQAEVDFVRGTAFSVTASYVRVKAAVDRDAIRTSPPIPFWPVRCAAFTSRGTRPTWRGPTRTQITLVPNPTMDNPTPVTGEWLQIPRYSRSVSLGMVAPSVFPPANHRVEIGTSQGQVINVGWVNGTNASQDVTDIELPIDARIIRVVNNAAPEEAALITQFRLIHHLAF